MLDDPNTPADGAAPAGDAPADDSAAPSGDQAPAA